MARDPFKNAKFDKQIKKYFEKDVKGGGMKNVRKISLTALAFVMRLSPVDNGTFRGNWNVALNRVDTSVDSTYTASPQQGTYDRNAYSRGSLVMKSYQAGQTINISNALPYAMRLEFGWSKQAPEGMVRKTQRLLVKELKKKKTLT